MEIREILSNVYYNAMLVDQLREQLEEYRRMKETRGDSERLRECVSAATNRLIEVETALNLWKSMLHAEDTTIAAFMRECKDVGRHGECVTPLMMVAFWEMVQ